MRHKIERFAKQEIGDRFPLNFEEAKRIYDLAKTLADDFDDDVLHAAAMLHAVIQGEQDFEKKAALYASDFLHSIGFPDEKIKKVVDCIENQMTKGRPKSIEAKMLHDAICLDFMGATGIAKLSGMTLYQWWGKTSLKDILELWEDFVADACYKSLYLKKSKKIGAWKRKFVKLAVKQLKAELMLGEVR